jgi:hypothetical protein
MSRVRVGEAVTTLAIVLLLIVILAGTWSFRAECKRKGGSPITGSQGWVCFAPGVVIP